MVLDLLLIGLCDHPEEPFPLTAFILVLSAEKGKLEGTGVSSGLAGLPGRRDRRGDPDDPETAQAKPSRPRRRPPSWPSSSALGVVLILLAVRQRRRIGRPRKPQAWIASMDRLSLWSAAGARRVPAALDAGGGRRHHGRRAAPPWGSYLALVFFCLLATAASSTSSCTPPSRPAKADARLVLAAGVADLSPGSGHHRRVCLLLGLWLTCKSIYLLVNT